MRLFLSDTKLDTKNMINGGGFLDFLKISALIIVHVYLSIIRLNHECCGSTSCCSFLRERERVHLSPHIPFDPAFARWAPVWLAPMAPPLRRQSEFQEFAFDAIDYRTVLSVFSSSTGSKHGPCVILTDHFLCVLLGGEPHRYRCYVLNPIVAIDAVVATILLEFNEHHDI